MVWFNKKEKKTEGLTLPDLPKLPSLTDITKEPRPFNSSPIPQLPSYPSSSFGEKFSQNAIKDAVSGEKEDDEEDFDVDEAITKEILPMHKPLVREETSVHRQPLRGNPKNEPVFVRLDNFEEGLKIFEDTKHKVMEIERMLRDIKLIKEEEEKELQNWGMEIQRLKGQFEKIDRDIFSKIY